MREAEIKFSGNECLYDSFNGIFVLSLLDLKNIFLSSEIVIMHLMLNQTKISCKCLHYCIIPLLIQELHYNLEGEGPSNAP